MEGKSNWMLLQPLLDLASKIPSKTLQDYFFKKKNPHPVFNNIISKLNHIPINLA